MRTSECGPDPTSWMLRNGLLHIFVCTTTLPSFPKTRFTQYRKVEPVCTVRSATNKLAAMFQFFSSSLVTALEMTCPSLPTTVVIHVESMDPVMSSTGFMFAEEWHLFIHASYISIGLNVRKRKRSSTIAGLPKKRHLNTTSANESASAVVKNENVLDVMEAAESSHASPEALASQDALPQAMLTIYCVNTEGFLNLLETL